MATKTFQAPVFCGTVESYRAYAQGISSALADLGFVKVTGIGEPDLATVALPSSNGGYTAWEVWRFNDALQATHPLFFRINYAQHSQGSYVQSTAGARPQINVGKSVDGTGNIGGSLTGGFQVIGFMGNTNSYGLGPGSSTAPLDCYTSSGTDKSHLAMSLFNGHNSPTPHFILERSRSADGTATGDGVMLAYVAGDTSVPSSAMTVTTTYSQPTNLLAIEYLTGATNRGKIPVVIPRLLSGAPLGSSGGMAVGAIAPVFPWTCYAPGVIPWQSRAGLSWVDYPGGQFTARLAGADRPFLSLAINNSNYGWGLAMESNQLSGFVGLGIAWE